MSKEFKSIKQGLNEAIEFAQSQPGEVTEYDFTDGIRGKHYKALQQGYTVKVHQIGGATLVQQFKRKERAVTPEPDTNRNKGK